LIGEDYINKFQIIKKTLSTLLRTKKFVTNCYHLFKPDDESGDHYYRVSDYYFIFTFFDYKITHCIVKDSIIIIADKTQ